MANKAQAGKTFEFLGRVRDTQARQEGFPLQSGRVVFQWAMVIVVERDDTGQTVELVINAGSERPPDGVGEGRVSHRVRVRGHHERVHRFTRATLPKLDWLEDLDAPGVWRVRALVRGLR